MRAPTKQEAKEEAAKAAVRAKGDRLTAALVQAFEAVPTPHRGELQKAAIALILHSYDGSEMAFGDGLLAMLPLDVAKELLDDYFGDD